MPPHARSAFEGEGQADTVLRRNQCQGSVRSIADCGLDTVRCPLSVVLCRFQLKCPAHPSMAYKLYCSVRRTKTTDNWQRTTDALFDILRFLEPKWRNWQTH